MSLINPGDFPIDANVVDGTELAARLNRLKLALYSGLGDVSRPPDITAGGIWVKYTPPSTYELMQYNGTTDVPFVSSGGVTTPPQFDNDTSPATTAFVQRALGNYGQLFVGAPRTLTAADMGMLFVVSSGTPATMNLPVASTCPGGTSVRVWNVTAAALTVSRQGSDFIVHGAGASASSVTLPPGFFAEFASTSTTFWYATGGNALGSSAPQFDNTTALATTAFVQRALGNFGGYGGVTNGGALTVADFGKFINAGAGVSSFSLPDILSATIPNGAAITVINNNGGDLLVARQGTAQIATGGLDGFTNSLTFKSGDYVTFIKVSSSTWLAIGTGTLEQSRGAMRDHVNFGYQRWHGGTMLQWGTTSPIPGAGSLAVTLPTTFPNAIFTAVPGLAGGPANYSIGVNLTSTSTLTFTNSGASPAQGRFMAVGY